MSGPGAQAGRAPKGHAPFAILNRTANRSVALLLRSPLHRLVSGRLALLTVTGRRTGKRHTLPVMYTREGSRLTVPVMWPERKLWWRNLRGGAEVEVRVRGGDLHGRGEAHVAPSGETVVGIELDAR
jgi:hypothetical protein